MPNKSAESLSTAVAQILLLPDHGREMGSRGQEFSQVNFDIRRAIGDFTKIYSHLKDGIKIGNEQLRWY